MWHVLVFHSDGLGVSMQSFLFQCFSIQRREGSLEVYGWALGIGVFETWAQPSVWVSVGGLS